MAHIIDLSEMTGEEIRDSLIEITDETPDEDWEPDEDYVFVRDGDNLFRLTPRWTRNQPRNGIISFWGDHQWDDRPRYKQGGLMDFLGKDFAIAYEDFEQNDFEEPDPTDAYFQLFVLFQFEIARRVEGDHPDLPRRAQTEIAIDIANELRTKRAYNTLIEMFSGYSEGWVEPVRLQHYMALRRMVKEDSNVAHYMANFNAE